MSKTYIPADLRRLVRDRAKDTCEYCLIPEQVALVPHQVDHVIAEKHGGQTNEANLALACALCNKYKGSDLASVDTLTGEIIRLYQPRCDRWSEHFRLVDGEMVPTTAIGRVTIKLLQLNRPTRILERRLCVSAGILNIPN